MTTGEGFSTRAIHGARVPEVRQIPASVPIYQTATWGFETQEEYAEVIAFERPGHTYGRGYGNPTVEAFEAVMAELEGTEAAFAFSSGMSAIHAVSLALAVAGDRVVVSRELYGGTYALFSKVLPRYGIEVEEVESHDLEAVRAALPGAAFFYVETIANPRCTVADLEALASSCRDAGVPAVIDNTFASPWLCNPASLGFDFVVHSVTKYIAGHSDVVAGVVCCSAQARSTVQGVAIEVGGAMQPFDAWLAIRGLQTLEVRLDRQCRSALILAEMLAGETAVSAVHYSGLVSHPQHERASKLLRPGYFGGMLSVEVSGGIGGAAAWCEALSTAWIGASLGGTHTLVTHPASTTHRQVAASERAARGLTDGLVRISTGLENIEDLLADFSHACRTVRLG
ncbi:MAG TPA: aminotransferase class I/II-fold pyridoxal phosphate-dependent enzyme [Acidimicrobiales bacterium]|nr:aminotransferase class I/II-fold pyridoxal phosphate-dependent enzyme [Acidimicrobiales bacterium]